METTRIKGELEIDHERGVIYFHNESTGRSVLRVSNIFMNGVWKERIPKLDDLDKSPVYGGLIDINAAPNNKHYVKIASQLHLTEEQTKALENGGFFSDRTQAIYGFADKKKTKPMDYKGLTDNV